MNPQTANRRRTRLIRSVSALLASSALCALPALAEEAVTPERLLNPEPENWLHNAANYAGWAYSPVDQITRDNVGQLGLAFAVSLGGPLTGFGFGGGSQQSVPLVDDGFIYITNPFSHVFKIDAGSGSQGNVVWMFDPLIEAPNGTRDRGVALSGDLAILNLTDGRVVGIDRESGEAVWDVQVGKPPEGFRGNPQAVKDKVIVTNSTGDGGTRGYIVALDPATGEEQWRFYAVPGPGEPGHETWPQDNDAWVAGGAGLWNVGTFDPETDLLIYGTGNPAPPLDPTWRAGDNLYTSSVVAVNADSGELDWYFQYTPNSGHEYDEIGVHLLYDAEINGEDRKVLGHFSRNGFFYTLDRLNGQFIGAKPYFEYINWTAGIDAKTGKPVEYDPNSERQEYLLNPRPGADAGGEGECPSAIGGAGAWPSAYVPELRIVFGIGENRCQQWTAIERTEDRFPEGREVGQGGLGGQYRFQGRGERPLGMLWAVDPTTGENLRTAAQPYPNHSGLVATGGGLLFSGTLDGAVEAYDPETLETVWSINVGTPFRAPPISYAVDGRQYVLISGGAVGMVAGMNVPAELGTYRYSGMLWAFALPQE